MRRADASVLAAVLAPALILGLAGCEQRQAEPPAEQSTAVQPPVIATPAGGAPSSFAPIVKRVSPAVVSIDTLAVAEGALPWLQGTPQGGLPGFAVPVQRGAGSGFIISADGYIVTNNHVVEGAQEIVATLADGRQLPARLVGRDPPSDLAVLKVDARELPFVSFARSALPEVGDWVVAVGNPFGLGGTATAGIVSAHGREIGEAYVSYLQIDAPINSGNSGGPSFDLQGRVVGVNTAIFSPSGGSVGIGFAIPADLAENVTQQLIKSGRVTRGYLGVGVQDLTPPLAARLGARGARGGLIVDVARGGPAAGALRPGDVVTAVNGEEITGAGGLTRAIAAAAPGSRLRLQVLRGGRRSEVTVTAARRPDDL
ncbi:serine protease HtrA [Phenylobacterium zucineum HLK1]|uniref:Serine protease HtrA n=1 Tax=Phenylobacterium zucineum (strain HLK1) TaxID=450851 RepID=B4R7W8_PHEZH|nr:trypsin-like peptidase domain-containing protein [Phenylobacterium zucineum]ACG77501.1 serine protease HtrA [Phenylobacterium zucineum HLK1]